ncbi:MAG: G2-specific serine/threonine protein kinase [Candelina mexicana]|nr:MAG: G2-specific serine/threonine protein kinase [Candelina mexicana]
MEEAEKYEIQEKIGHGSFGIIRKVKRRSDGHILCRKEINYVRMSQKEREQLHAEFSILKSLRHPNIVAYYKHEHLKATQDIHVYMEYCGNGDLMRVIKNHKEKRQYPEESFVWSIFAQLVTALYRCHYGVDPPEVGSNVLGLGNTAKPAIKGKSTQVMILHRDLKPENVFLGADNSVKLGDFGLSKIMQSHDFASTYVGTPYYMSPEICAAERYTLHSDIWSLGCIIYELCTNEPPFNARSHFELVSKIKVGKFNPLPSCYSQDLQKVISDCLRVNPNTRPETATLLNLPAVKLMRKEREVVELGQLLRTREEQALQKCSEADAKVARLRVEEERRRGDIEAAIRREWEVKARLEIDRRVQIELERLQKTFEIEVKVKVEAEVEKRMQQLRDQQQAAPVTIATEEPARSSINASDTDFPTSTDLSDLSLDSPVSVKSNPSGKGTRTPFARSQTMFVGSPMDVSMVDPSPMSIASLSLSPRRTGGAAGNNPAMANAQNIFAAAAQKKWNPTLPYSDDEEEDNLPSLPSPTRQKPLKNPFKPNTRPPMLRQKTAPMHKLNTQQNLFTTATTSSKLVSAQKATSPGTAPPRIVLKEHQITDPNQTLVNPLPSGPSVNESASPTRKGQLKSKRAKGAMNPQDGGDGMLKAVMQRNMVGRTLVELAQARGAGRPLDGTDLNGDAEYKTKAQYTASADTAIKYAAKMVEREVVWDPEKDEMPSPFLIRGAKGIRRL